MPEQIINASGPQYGLVVNSDGSINVSGIDLTIGSLALSLESVYVTSGNVAITDEVPTDPNKNNPYYKFEYSGAAIGSITQFVGAGSYVQALSYNPSDQITSVGSWS